MSSREQRSADFPQTRWSLVLNAQDDDPEALAALCKAYWFPLYAYARRLRGNASDAEDLTQAFFEFLLSKDVIKGIHQQRGGRLRGWLQVAFKNFATSQWRKDHALKRGGSKSAISIDQVLAEQRWSEHPPDQLTPEVEFDRSWAREVLRQAREQLRKAYAESGKSDVFDALQEQIDPFKTSEPTYDDAADRLGLSVSGTRFHAFKLRRRFRDRIEQVIGDTVASPQEVAEELAYLQRVFENPNA